MNAVTYSNDIINTKIILNFVTHPQLTLMSSHRTFYAKKFGQSWHCCAALALRISIPQSHRALMG